MYLLSVSTQPLHELKLLQGLKHGPTHQLCSQSYTPKLFAGCMVLFNSVAKAAAESKGQTK